MSKCEESKYPLRFKHWPKKQTHSLAYLSKQANVRIIQKHLVYVIGLSSNLANKDILGKFEYFGQYGTIVKIVVNTNKAYNPNGSNGPSFSGYISYSNPQEASLAILAVDNTIADDHTLRASFGTTKYCTYYLKNSECPNKECLYLHYLAESDDVIYRNDMNSNKNIFYEQQLLAMKLCDLFHPDVRKRILSLKNGNGNGNGNNSPHTVLPALGGIYTKDIIAKHDPDNPTANQASNTYHTNKKKYEYDYSEYEYGYDNNNNNNEHNDDNEFYSDYYSNTNGNYQNDEIEYVLVREKNDRRYQKARGNSKKNLETVQKMKSDEESYRNTNHNSDIGKNNNSMSAEDNNPNSNKTNDDLNLVENNPSISKSTSVQEIPHQTFSSYIISNEDNKNKNKNINNIHVNEAFCGRKKLFRKHKKSRFDFVKTDITQLEEVPEFICDMICKKISGYTFFKQFQFFYKLNDLEFFTNELSSNKNGWTDFIKANLVQI